ncbi:MAG: ABC transporter transmembrane domain-containing protein [Egibacteraceae bacterium]
MADRAKTAGRGAGLVAEEPTDRLKGRGLAAGGLLRRVIRGQWRRVAVALVFAMLHQAAEAGVPVMVGVVIGRAVATGDLGSLVWGIIGLTVLFAGLSGSWLMAARMYFWGLLGAAHDVRMAVTRRVLDPGGGAGAALPGALLSTATADARRVAEVHQAAVFGAAAVAALGVAAGALLSVSVVLGLVVLASVPLVLAAVQLAAKGLERRSAAEQAAAAQAAAVATDLVTGLRVLKGLGAEEAAAARYRQASRSSLASTLRAVGMQAGLGGFTVALTGVVLAVVAWVGGRLAVQGSISVAGLVAAVGLTQFLVGPFSFLSSLAGDLARARASAGRVAELLSTPPAVTDGGTALARPVRGALALRGVAHAGLRSLDLRVEPGELVGVVAPDPADAAALLACLGRTVDPRAGVVEVDGVPLAALNLDDVLAAVLVAAHDARLFDGTLAGNVAAGGAADGARVDAAMAAAAADEVASSLPDGAGTVLTELGRSLSGGQRQRVALARALTVDPPVLVLHDPTTAVDAATEHRIAAGLRAARAGRATLVVTTSPGLLAAADRVVLLNGGEVAAEGTHAALLRADGRYRAAVLGVPDSGERR